MLTSIGRYLPVVAQVKNKIKHVDGLPGNDALHRDIPLIFNHTISMLTRQLSLCVIAVDCRSAGRFLALSLLATLSTIVLWLIGYYSENKGLNQRYQANYIQSRQVISYLTLAENVLRHSPLILRRMVLSTLHAISLAAETEPAEEPGSLWTARSYPPAERSAL
jgi:hypothetical protein